MNQAEQAILNGEPRLVYGQPELNDKDALILTFLAMDLQRVNRNFSLPRQSAWQST